MEPCCASGQGPTSWHHLPHQPLPATEDTCAAFLALARARTTSDAEMAALAEEVERLRTSPTAAQVQQWLAQHHHHGHGHGRQDHHDKGGSAQGNIYTQTFFSRLHLANRDPLPFGENYSVVLQPLARRRRPRSASLAQAAACVTRAALAFWAGLSGSDRDQFLRRVEGTMSTTSHSQLPECGQYHALFGSARLPAKGHDTQHASPSPILFSSSSSASSSTPSQASFVVACRGHLFAVAVPSRDVPSASTAGLRATLAAIARHASGALRPTSASGHHQLMGLLTCMERDAAAALRARLAQQHPECEHVLSVVQNALFLVCLDDADADADDIDSGGNVSDSPASQVETDGVRVEAGELERRHRLREVFNGVPDLARGQCNRWFEKGLQFIVAADRSEQAGDDGADVMIGLNVEHSFADSGVVHKLCSFLWQEAQASYEADESDDRYGDGGEVQSYEWRHLSWGPLDEEVRGRLSEVQAAVIEQTRALADTTVDCIVHGVGRQFFKDHNASPDACFQIALHIASCVDEAKYVWNLETLDARHYLDGRLMIADVFTAEFRALQAALFDHLDMHGDGGDVDSGGARLRDALDACGENEGLVALFEKAIDGHLEVLARHKAGMESYLHLFLLTNEMGTLPDHPPHALTDNPIYEAAYRHHIVGSNLGNDAGIEFVFSGIPPAQSMDVLGYMLADDHIKLTLTSRSAIRRSFLPTLISALALVQRWARRRTTTATTTTVSHTASL